MRTIMMTASLVFAFAIPAAAQTWEYEVTEVDLVTKVRVFANDLLLTGDELEAVLEPLGAEGWELVGMIPRGGTSVLLVFKRPSGAGERRAVTGVPISEIPPVMPVREPPEAEEEPAETEPPAAEEKPAETEPEDRSEP